MVGYSFEQCIFAVENSIRWKNLMIDLLMNFISSVQNQLYAANHMSNNCTKSSMALGQLLIGSNLNQSVCWHPKNAQIGSRKIPLSIVPRIQCLQSFCSLCHNSPKDFTIENVLCDFYLWRNLKQKLQK